ncbi:8976_t:CDS:2, partial [Diversispora eburnea]
AENIKLKHDKEVVEARFTNLEHGDKEKSDLIAKLQRSDKEKTNLIAKLEQNDKDTAAGVAKLEQKQSQDDEKSNFIAKSDDDTREINQSSVIITSTKTENSNGTHKQKGLRFSNLSCETKTIGSGNDQTEISELEQDDETDKNQIVEQGLIEELYLSTDRQSLIDSAIDNTSSTEINISKNKGSAQHLSNLFKTAIKS